MGVCVFVGGVLLIQDTGEPSFETPAPFRMERREVLPIWNVVRKPICSCQSETSSNGSLFEVTGCRIQDFLSQIKEGPF